MSVIDRARALAEAGDVDRALGLLGEAADDDGAATASIRLRHEFFNAHDFDEPPPFPAIHAVADSPAEIPRVDLASHAGRDLCWQCHYPHFPEAGG